MRQRILALWTFSLSGFRMRAQNHETIYEFRSQKTAWQRGTSLRSQHWEPEGGRSLWSRGQPHPRPAKLHRETLPQNNKWVRSHSLALQQRKTRAERWGWNEQVGSKGTVLELCWWRGQRPVPPDCETCPAPDLKPSQEVRLLFYHWMPWSPQHPCN